MAQDQAMLRKISSSFRLGSGRASQKVNGTRGHSQAALTLTAVCARGCIVPCSSVKSV